MHVSSAIAVPRVDVAALRRLVPPLWIEWANLEFTSQGWLRDPDNGQPLGILRLAQGRHRVPGAHYAIVKDKQQVSFVLASDDGRTVRGTLSSQWWSADLEIGDQLSASGRADVGAVLRANEVPGLLIPLIGGRAATGSVHIDPSALDRSGDLVRGQGAAQRGAGEFVLALKTKHDEWHARMTVRVNGRGLLGRLALLGFRSKVRSAIREAIDEFLGDTKKQAIQLESELGEVENEVRNAGGEVAFVHKYLWSAVRELALPVGARTGAASPAASPGVQPTAAMVGSPVRLRRGPLGIRRLERPAELHFPVQAEQYLLSHGSLTKTNELIVRPGGDRLTVHWPSSGRYDSPPVFHGRVERQSATLTISGTIRETRLARGWSWGWGFVTGLMALVAIFGLYGLAIGTAQAYLPLLIGVIASPIFALFWRGARGDRRPDFTRQSGALVDGMQRWFTSGDGLRTYLF